MPISMYQASVPVFVRALNVLATLLDRGEGFAADKGIDPNSLVQARLAPDMLPFSGQIQRASDSAKFAVVRLTGREAPRFEDNEATFPELGSRIANTIAYLQSVDAAAFEGSETKPIEFKAGPTELKFVGTSYLLGFAIPNFFFHVTTAYDILRHKGVPIGKGDFLGPAPE